MSTVPRVREAHSDDAGLLHDILLRAFSEYEGRLDPPSGVHSETIASIRNKVNEGGALICEAGGDVAGCVFYAPKAGYLYGMRDAAKNDKLQRRCEAGRLTSCPDVSSA